MAGFYTNRRQYKYNLSTWNNFVFVYEVIKTPLMAYVPNTDHEIQEKVHMIAKLRSG